MKFRLTHLALLLALSTLITALSGIFATYWSAKDEFRDVLDDDLENQSRLLSELLTLDSVNIESADLHRLLSTIFHEKDEETLWVSVYDLDNDRLISNLDHALPLESEDDGEVSLQLEGHHWYGFQHNEDDLVVQLLRKDDRFDDILHEMYEDLVTPMLVVSGVNFLLLAVFIWLAIRPLYRLGKELETRNTYSLTPVDLKSPTYEIDLLTNTLNRLMGGVSETLSRERQFANDVAHELRTPLTTLKLELASEDPSFGALKEEVNRLAQLVAQLLTLARVDQGHWRSSFETVALHEVCTQEIGRQTPALAAADIDVHQNLVDVFLQGDAVLLQVLLRNLLNNVLNHCPHGTRVDVLLERQPGSALLQISDTGPGLDIDVLSQLNTGFTRMDSRAGGLGLGLAICRKIADVHAADLTFATRDDGQSGLQIRLNFPLETRT